MNTIIPKIKLFFLLALLPGLCFADKQDRHQQQLDSLFSMLCKQQQFNGSVLIAEKGKIIFEKGYGYRNEETKQLNNGNTIFELASCSKQFTAAAIVLLKRQGKLSYEDKISKYLPELSFWDKVTIADLLHHTSGIPEFIGNLDTGADSTKIATNKDLIRFYAAKKDTLQFEPKSRHRYCNTNYALLASIIERVSGKSYADFLQQNIFKPLKMQHTFVYSRRIQARKLPNFAIGYAWAHGSFKKVTPDQPEYGEYMAHTYDGIVGAAKVNATVEDVYKWINALKSNSLLSKAEFEEMTAVTQTSRGRDLDYGFGFMLSKGANRFSFGHNGSWDGYASLIFHNMLKDRTVIILQNFKLGVFPYNNIVQILEDKPLELVFHKELAMPQKDMERYAGTYRTDADTTDAHVISYLDGHLVYNTMQSRWDLRFYPVSEQEFQGIRQASDDSYLKFTPMENGDMKLEMLQDGKVLDSGIRKK